MGLDVTSLGSPSLRRTRTSSAERASNGFVWAGMVALLLMFTFAPVRDVLIRFVQDDAFYYFEVARRLGSGQGSTFDGINPTNGYHPLWQLLLVPLAPLMNASREGGVRAAATLSLIFLGGAAF